MTTSEPDIFVRPETPADFPAVRDLLLAAFGGSDEADLVEALREDPAYVPELALVAEAEGTAVGHLMLTEASVPTAEGGELTVLALAPVAVAPAFQRTGVGSLLIEVAHALAATMGYPAVIVLGHPGYYPRFGYVPASRFGVRAPFDVPDEAFMALELAPGALASAEGVLAYAPPFGCLTA